MNKIALFLVTIVMSISLISQTPQAFKYQAVVRDDLGELVTNQTVSFRISIHDSIAAGPVQYQETHIVLTDSYGHANLEIGIGNVTIGVFTDVDWNDDDKFLEVELDLEGGDAYIVMGTTQLLAVPYSLYAESTGDTTRWRKNMDDLYYLDGKVGIGTISPQYNLDIYGSATGQSRLRLTNPDNSKILLFGSGSDLYNSSITFQGGDALRFMQYDGGYSELMRIRSDGNVGIGTPIPAEKLSILGNIELRVEGYDPYIRLNSDDAGDGTTEYIWSEDSKGLAFGDTHGSPQVLIEHVTGNVGIGTETPTEMLEVAGAIYSTTGGFRFPDGSMQATAATGGTINNTLDQAYDQGGAGAGRTINADAGAVTIEGSSGLAVIGNLRVGTSAASYPISIRTTTPIRAINIDHNQTDDVTTSALFIDLDQINDQGSEIFGGELTATNWNGTGRSTGLYAQADGSSTGIKIGVQGRAEGEGSHFGLYGSAYGSGMQVGVYGHADGGGTLYAGYFDGGNVYIRNRLGIGISSPAAGLHLSGDAYPNSFMFIEAETGGDAGIRLYEGSNDKWHIFNNVTDDGLHIHNAPGQTVFFAEQSTGNVGIGTTNPASRLDVQGNVTIRDINTGEIAIELGKGLDYAEGFNVTDKTTIEPGTILCIDPENPGKLKISEHPYDKTVAGIVAGANGLGSGVRLGTEEFDCDVALAGRVYCNAIANTENIKPGDLLTTSSIPGFAMKVTDNENSHGAIIGKAMQSLEKGERGQILVLVTLH